MIAKTSSPQRPNPDRAALARVGEVVRKRLAADPAIYRIPTDRAEIFVLGDFLSPAECDRLIALIEASAEPSRVFDPENPEKYRTSSSGNVDRSDSFVRMIERRIDDLVGLDGNFGETVQGQRYQVGQQYRGHHDWFYTDLDYWPGEASLGGQRSWTAMVYLNDVEEGGHTDFIDLGVTITPQRGALLLWNNARPDGVPNPDTLHAGMPVISGVKYVITKWYRTRRWGIR